MYYLYIIYSEKSDKYYIGHTKDPARRLIEHNNDPRPTFTSKHRPWILKAVIAINGSKGNAVKIEKYLKQQKSRKIIEAVIESQNNMEKIFQLLHPGHQGNLLFYLNPSRKS